jgi:site-specific recombinase XerD
MSPRGYSERSIQQPCEACGALIPADCREVSFNRFFCCQAMTARVGNNQPDQCWIRKNGSSEDTRAALKALPSATSAIRGEKTETLAARRDILMRYIREIGTGEPPLEWYRAILKSYRTVTVTSALSALPYWKAEKLRFPSISNIQSIDRQVDKWITKGDCPEFADLLGGYVEHHYDIMEFGFQHGQFGEQVAVKLNTIQQMVFKLGHYLDWLYQHGHRNLHEAGRMWLSRYMAEFQRRPTYGYAINKFYQWSRTKNRFIPALNFNRRHGKSIRDHEAEKFDVLTLEQARAAYDRICLHPDPQGRFLAFMALLYSQTIVAIISLRRSDLVRSEKSGCWIVKSSSDDGFELEPEVSSALDECLNLADKHSRFLGSPEEQYIFPGRNKHYISRSVASEKIREASGHKGEVLRRTGVINMFRSGQKTMGTIVLRDQLKVSIPIIQRAIKLAGHSVNAELDRDAAEEFRRAFLAQDDE